MVFRGIFMSRASIFASGRSDSIFRFDGSNPAASSIRCSGPIGTPTRSSLSALSTSPSSVNRCPGRRISGLVSPSSRTTTHGAQTFCARSRQPSASSAPSPSSGQWTNSTLRVSTGSSRAVRAGRDIGDVTQPGFGMSETAASLRALPTSTSNGADAPRRLAGGSSMAELGTNCRRRANPESKPFHCGERQIGLSSPIDPTQNNPAC
jgi:hypothetical protein